MYQASVPSGCLPSTMALSHVAEPHHDQAERRPRGIHVAPPRIRKRAERDGEHMNMTPMAADGQQRQEVVRSRSVRARWRAMVPWSSRLIQLSGLPGKDRSRKGAGSHALRTGLAQTKIAGCCALHDTFSGPMFRAPTVVTQGSGGACRRSLPAHAARLAPCCAAACCSSSQRPRSAARRGVSLSQRRRARGDHQCGQLSIDGALPSAVQTLRS